LAFVKNSIGNYKQAGPENFRRLFHCLRKFSKLFVLKR
jgi:hypothetical protein